MSLSNFFRRPGVEKLFLKMGYIPTEQNQASLSPGIKKLLSAANSMPKEIHPNTYIKASADIIVAETAKPNDRLQLLLGILTLAGGGGFFGMKLKEILDFATEPKKSTQAPEKIATPVTTEPPIATSGSVPKKGP